MMTKLPFRPVIVLALVGLLLTLGFSLRFGRNSSQPPAADLSSPERALKSYWSLRQWASRHQLGEQAPKAAAAATSLTLAEVMSAVTAGGTRDSFQTRPGTQDPLEWSLLRIEQTSDTQAVATARIRNRARDPMVVTPTPIELFSPATGTELRYVLLKDASGWRVAEVWRLDAEDKRVRER